MLVDKKGLFKEFDVVVNGKFVALLVAPYESYQGMYGVFEFYFGVYNHKYFSMCPKFGVDCYNPCGSSEDFRLATDDEKKEFFKDCRSFGYDWDVDNNHFRYCDAAPHILETKKQFLDMKLPKYIPLSKIDGEIVLEILKFNNEDGDMFFVLDDNYYSHIKTRYMVCNNSDCTFIDILKYECDESFDGHHLIEGLGGEVRFTNLKDDDLVFGVARLCWWFFVDKFFDFSLRYSDTKPNDFSKLTPEHLSEFGKMMIGQGWVDDKVIFQLAREYMQFGWFCSLCGELANIRKIELETKKNSQFDL